MAWRQGCDVVLITINIHDDIGRHILGIAARKDIYASRCVRARQLRRRDLEAKRNRSTLGRHQSGIDSKRRGAGEKVVLPDVRRNDGDRTSHMKLQEW